MNGIVLKQTDQARVATIIANSAKAQPNLLKFSEVLMLLIDRCIFSTKFIFGDFYAIFNKSQLIKSSVDKSDIQGQRYVTKQQLIFIFNEIGKKLFKSDLNYQQRFYNTFLSQKIAADSNDEINYSRVMVFDDINKKLVLQEIISVIVQYQTQIKQIFISYLIENYWTQRKNKRVLLTLRQIILQNKRWSFTSFIHFLKESESTPHIISIQQIQQFTRLIIPNTNSKQQQFYSKHIMSDVYHKQGENNEETSHSGDPGIMLFEFQFLIARIAYESYPKQMQKKSLKDIILRYFKYLSIRNNQEFNTQPLPNFSRKMITKMKQYYQIKVNIQSEKQKDHKSVELRSQVQMLSQKMSQEITNAPLLGFQFKEAYKVLDKQLPKMPPLPQINQQNPPPFKKNQFIVLGQQPPPQPVDKNDKPQKAQKKQAGKKDQIPPRIFQWDNIPQTKYAIEDFLKQAQTKLYYEVKPLSDISRGVIKKQVYPVIIGQILFPPQLPLSVTPYIIAASNALCDRNFYLALQNYSKGLQQWKKTSVDLDAQAQLFFQYSRGNVYLSCGKLQYALQAFYNCRKYSDTAKLPFSNPDRSLPYYGLGQVFYQMQEYELASRSFLKARQIRQNVLGLEHVQTASVFNNLGCCYYMLRRTQQALGYIEIAQVVMDTELGSHHERTMTSRNNLKLITTGYSQNKPQYKILWQVFEQDKFQKKKKKKSKDGQKKKK